MQPVVAVEELRVTARNQRGNRQYRIINSRQTRAASKHASTYGMDWLKHVAAALSVGYAVVV